jgi:hypothetical protein
MRLPAPMAISQLSQKTFPPAITQRRAPINTQRNLVKFQVVPTYNPSSSIYLVCGPGCCGLGGLGGKKIFLDDVDVI